MVLNIKNETAYPTATLRRILRLVLASEAAQGRRIPRRDTVVNIEYCRKGNLRGEGYRGCATYSGRLSHLRVPRTELDVAKFAALWQHEAWHLFGIRHEDFPRGVLYCHADPLAWVVDKLGGVKTILPEAAAPKPVIDLAAARQVRLTARLTDWTRRLRRAQTYVAKIKRSLAYYERKAAGKVEEPHE